MNLIEFSHANIDTKVAIIPELVFSVYYSPGHKATLIMSSGGAMVPVKEDVEQVKKQIEETTNGKRHDD